MATEQPSVRRLIIWRHGQTTHNAAGIWQGQLDTDLSEVGRAQAEAAAAALVSYDPALLWSSDLRRARHTADALARLANLTPQLDQRFREIDVGEWQGLTAGDVAERYPELQEQVSRGEDPARGVHGETMAQVVARAHAGVEDLLAQLPEGQTAVVATHGGTGRGLAADLVGIDPVTSRRALGGLHNCHWIVLEERGYGWRVESWNAGATS